ncbi:integrase core domain-containing protein [Kitasatospora atroaurantiaca]|uniref:integrase core domain-containing protein n=1 Tax=Kitasatospora atroaurantiaca TaxID=285545 RepID=UPI003CCC5F16
MSASPWARRQQRGQRSGRELQRHSQTGVAARTQRLDHEREARLAVFRWAHRYNTVRRHSSLGHRSPIAYETALSTTSTTLTKAASPVSNIRGQGPRTIRSQPGPGQAIPICIATSGNCDERPYRARPHGRTGIKAGAWGRGLQGA